MMDTTAIMIPIQTMMEPIQIMILQTMEPQNRLRRKRNQRAVHHQNRIPTTAITTVTLPMTMTANTTHLTMEAATQQVIRNPVASTSKPTTSTSKPSTSTSKPSTSSSNDSDYDNDSNYDDSGYDNDSNYDNDSSYDDSDYDD